MQESKFQHEYEFNWNYFWLFLHCFNVMQSTIFHKLISPHLKMEVLRHLLARMSFKSETTYLLIWSYLCFAAPETDPEGLLEQVTRTATGGGGPIAADHRPTTLSTDNTPDPRSFALHHKGIVTTSARKTKNIVIMPFTAGKQETADQQNPP